MPISPDPALLRTADPYDLDQNAPYRKHDVSLYNGKFYLFLTFDSSHEFPEQWRGWTIDILGTDVSNSCIDRARSGVFTQFEIQRGLGINQMIKWFEEVADGWRAVEPLRKPVRFQVHNILEAAPHPGDFDVVLCRNVLLYLSPEKKAVAFERIASAMAGDGWLMLGAGETVIGNTNKLGADVNVRGLYRLKGDGSGVEKRAGSDRRASAGA